MYAWVQARGDRPDARPMPRVGVLNPPACGRAAQYMEYVAAGDIVDGVVHLLGTSGMLKRV